MNTFSDMKFSSVSIIIPCHQQIEFLPVCLTSIAMQTYQAAEIIIIDDGSIDDMNESLLIVKNFPGLPEIKVYRHATQLGTSMARNRGFTEARSDWVLPLDADDAISSTFLEKALLTAKNDKVIVYPDFQTFGDESAISKMRSEFDIDELCKSNFMIAGSLIPLDAWNAVRKVNGEGFVNEVWKLGGYEDQLFFIECALNGYIGRPLSEPLYFYRHHHKSRTHMAIYKQNVPIIREFMRQHLHKLYGYNMPWSLDEEFTHKKDQW